MAEGWLLCSARRPRCDWIFAETELCKGRGLRADGTDGGIHSGDRRFCENMFDLLARGSGSRNASAGTPFAIRIRRCCEEWALNSKSCRSCCVTQRCDPHWMSIPRRSRWPNMQRRQPCRHWFLRMKQAEPRSRRHLLMLRDGTLRRGRELKGTQKKAQKRALLGPRWFKRNRNNPFGMNGGDDGTRTRGLCRDRAAF
jgi:hypothetical protein